MSVKLFVELFSLDKRDKGIQFIPRGFASASPSMFFLHRHLQDRPPCGPSLLPWYAPHRLAMAGPAPPNA